jgi:hypothetical protein
VKLTVHLRLVQRLKIVEQYLYYPIGFNGARTLPLMDVGVNLLQFYSESSATLTTDRLQYKLRTRLLVREDVPRRRVKQLTGKKKEKENSGHGPEIRANTNVPRFGHFTPEGRVACTPWIVDWVGSPEPVWTTYR